MAPKGFQATAPAPTSGGLRRSPNSLTSLLLESQGSVDVGVFNPVLTELGSFTDKMYGSVSLEARKLLIEQTLPSIDGRRAKLQDALELFVATSPVPGFQQRVEKMQVPHPDSRAPRAWPRAFVCSFPPSAPLLHPLNPFEPPCPLPICP